MSDQEQTKFMIQSLVNKFDEHSDYVKKELSTIKRGVYGDPDNKVPGLIDRQDEDERRIKELEDHNKHEKIKRRTIMWALGVIYTVLQAVGIAVYEFFKSLK